ncbi:hypothetical protein M406DRAFT_75499 [Cryphonectria parasitica EP155]|uniref:Uncharacterized protein n=1 Tax=Cryphonectria parasitica (strain ATCC 38755 / EP155) TaxID=660469 RepID=A0A9P4Y865_CRYP1|nr:uncharacterized protein M406DRAFT_75499 [Cryphonectria parasitica EP155]KAF3768235.1 hypothetical protein M406DRAFT_75499 [Cryphonectria parasitica EP155]
MEEHIKRMDFMFGEFHAAVTYLSQPCQNDRGSKQQKCNHCENDDGPFQECVVLADQYQDRCANCIMNKRRDCSYTTSYVEPDDAEYQPSPSQRRQQRLQRQQLERPQRQQRLTDYDDQQSQLLQRRRQRLRRRQSERSQLQQRTDYGTEGNPIDLTDD